ncbi:RNA-dependent RNA polymerase-type, partial [Parasponia andersonii]
MELEGTEIDTVITQVSIGGFGRDVNAKDLMDFLEDEVGVVFRCRLKTSWTPSESYPKFEVADTAHIERADDARIVEPHAFVHFALSDSATWALK